MYHTLFNQSVNVSEMAWMLTNPVSSFGAEWKITFPSIPCRWVWPHDQVLTNGMWSEWCKPYPAHKESRHSSSLSHHFLLDECRDLEVLKDSRTTRQKEPGSLNNYVEGHQTTTKTVSWEKKKLFIVLSRWDLVLFVRTR